MALSEKKCTPTKAEYKENTTPPAVLKTIPGGRLQQELTKE
jgi:hypothetical protein